MPIWPLILFGHPSNASAIPHNPAAAPSNPDSAAAGKTYILFEGTILESVLLTRRGAAIANAKVALSSSDPQGAKEQRVLTDEDGLKSDRSQLSRQALPRGGAISPCPAELRLFRWQVLGNHRR